MLLGPDIIYNIMSGPGSPVPRVLGPRPGPRARGPRNFFWLGQARRKKIGLARLQFINRGPDIISYILSEPRIIQYKPTFVNIL